MENRIREIRQDRTLNTGKSTGKILFSSLRHYSHEQGNAPLSLKLVLNGNEHYHFNRQKYQVREHEFVICNLGDTVKLNIDSSSVTCGICLYPSNNLLKSAFQYLNTPLERTLEKLPNKESIHFTQKINSIDTSSHTGRFLLRALPGLVQLVEQNTSLSQDLFFEDLAQSMVLDQLAIEGQLKSLKAAKKETREELYRRLHLCRDYIHDNYREKTDIDELAKISCLSSYHLIRSFKALFGLSPYQYLLSRKLEEASKLQQQAYSFSQISELVGFSDPKNLKRALKRRNKN